MTVTIELDAEIEEQLHEQAAVLGTTVESFAVKSVVDSLNRLRHRPSPPIGNRLSAEESRLMIEINRGLPEATWLRYRELNQKRRDEAITDEQLTELRSLNDVIEGDRVRRLELVVELAKLRGVTFDSLMNELGLWRSTTGD